MRGTRTATRTEASVSSPPNQAALDFQSPPVDAAVFLTAAASFSPLLVSNTRFIAAVLERHTHTPERRRRYWGRSGTESDHGRTRHSRFHPSYTHTATVKSYEAVADLLAEEVTDASQHRWMDKK